MNDYYEVYLAIGGNTKPRRRFLTDCLNLLNAVFPVGFNHSSFYRTDPFLGLDQPSYLNSCARILTNDSPVSVLSKTSAIEQKLGRIRDGSKWQDRTIDIDILLYGNKTIDLASLKIPHYDLLNRDFFIIPLLEINPDLVFPLTGKRLDEYLPEIPRSKLTNPIKVLVD